jgi:UDP-N-acetylmuramate dehydrogenase
MSSLIRNNIPLAPLTSWLVGGPAEYYAQPKSVDELRDAMKFSDSRKLPVTILGGGTNVLINDSGIKGLTIALKSLSGLQAEIQNGRLGIECLAGTSKSELLKTFLKHKLAPALFLAGLPGDVGGAIPTNAGVGEMIKPREFVEITDWIEVMRPQTYELVRFTKDQLQWSYRHCDGWKPGVITRVGISWPNEPDPDVLTKVRDANKVRLSKQPLDMPSCGSVFVNPVGHKSGHLIEQCGLKGFSVGGAKVSEKHANFIVNFGNATAADIDGVIKHVQQIVKLQKGVDLKTEVVYLGF